MPDVIDVVLPADTRQSIEVVVDGATAVATPTAIIELSLEGPPGPRGSSGTMGPSGDSGGVEADPPVNLTILFENAII